MTTTKKQAIELYGKVNLCEPIQFNEEKFQYIICAWLDGDDKKVLLLNTKTNKYIYTDIIENSSFKVNGKIHHHNDYVYTQQKIEYGTNKYPKVLL